MNSQQAVLRRVCRAGQLRTQPSTTIDLSRLLSSLYLHPHARRPLHTSRTANAPRNSSPPSVKQPVKTTATSDSKSKQMTPKERMIAAQRRAQEKIQKEQKELEASLTQGGLAPSSAFGAPIVKSTRRQTDTPTNLLVENPFEDRNFSNMDQALNPRPHARLRWQRKMVIREIKHRGRLNKTVRLARTEREYAARSHFFKTSMKKLAPLARQIAGKSIDDAILQMRFSNKKVAQDVRQHLIQARNEAIVVKGMGLGRVGTDGTDLHIDPSETPPLPHQTALKTYKKGEAPDPTDLYIAQAWTNKGPYGQEPDYRARGRMYLMRPPHTGLTVLLKEEKTRTREKAEKEAKALRKRTGKSMWVHLPDRPVTAQRQHVLW